MSKKKKIEKRSKGKNSLAFCSNPIVGRGTLSGMSSSSTQQLHINPPEQRSTGRPPPRTQLILRPQSNVVPLYVHVCGITETNQFPRVMHNFFTILLEIYYNILFHDVYARIIYIYIFDYKSLNKLDINIYNYVILIMKF